MISYLYPLFFIAFFIVSPALAEKDFSFIFVPPACQDEAYNERPNTSSEQHDRYGHEIITDFDLQKSLVAKGLAITYPKFFETPDQIIDLYETETKARQNKTGCVWTEADIFKNADSIKNTNRFLVVEGVVIDTYKSRENTYLNFGQDWKTDFTVRIQNKNKAFKDFDHASYIGKTIRVRGFVTYYNGPSLTLSHPLLLENSENDLKNPALE